MTQYGRPDYWDERYTRYYNTLKTPKNLTPHPPSFAEILNPLIGIKDFLVSRMSLLNTLTPNQES